MSEKSREPLKAHLNYYETSMPSTDDSPDFWSNVGSFLKNMGSVSLQALQQTDFNLQQNRAEQTERSFDETDYGYGAWKTGQSKLGEANYGNSWHRGEQPEGLNTDKSPQQLRFNDDNDLALKLWDNYQNGGGQPVEIDMRQLNFDENLPFIKHLENTGALKVLRQKNILEKKLSEALGKKLDLYPRGSYTVIRLKEPITNMQLNFNPLSHTGKWASLGRLGVDMKDIDIVVQHDEENKIKVWSDIVPPKSSSTTTETNLDYFDFNPDQKRSWYAEPLVWEVHNGFPAGTSFQIHGKNETRFHQEF